MNTKVIAFSAGILGVALLVTYLVLNKTSSKPVAPGSPVKPPPYTPPVKTAAASVGSSSPGSPSTSTGQYRSDDSTKFIMGNDVFANKFTDLYDDAVFAQADISGSAKQDENIGQYAGSSGNFVMVNSPKTGLSFVNKNDVYQMFDVGT